MNLETYSRAQVARFCIGEAAHYGGINHMLAVAWIIHNRVMDGQGDWLEVLEQAPEKRMYQFEQPKIDYRNAHIRTFLQRVDEIATGREEEDPTNGALWYTDSTLPQKSKYLDAIQRNRQDHQLVAQNNPFLMFD